MKNCQAQPHEPAPANDVASVERLDDSTLLYGAGRTNRYDQSLPDRARWPNTRKALVLWTQEHLDRELAKMPRPEWFDRALAAHITERRQP